MRKVDLAKVQSGRVSTAEKDDKRNHHSKEWSYRAKKRNAEEVPKYRRFARQDCNRNGLFYFAEKRNYSLF